MLIVLSMLMGALLGFAAHRAGLCTVKAVAEVLTTRRVNFLWSFVKSSLWVMALSALAAAVPLEIGLRHWPLSGLSVAGGVLFGLGAGINGGCTFSTLSRLMDGNLNVLATVLMWPVGIVSALTLMSGLRGATPANVPDGQLPLWLSVPIGLFVLWEAALLVRRLAQSGSLRHSIGAPIYTLSAGAALVGGANAVLLLAWGPWSFTGTLLCALEACTVARCGTSQSVPLLVLAAALVGMALSSWQRGSFRLQRLRAREAMRHAGGGLLMGIGAMFIPGGNDGLILFGIPSLSPHAIPAYLGILAGVAIALSAMRMMGRVIPPVLCEGDICRTT